MLNKDFLLHLSELIFHAIFCKINDTETRHQAVSSVSQELEKFLEKTAFGIQCDEYNNTVEMVDKGYFVLDLYISPWKFSFSLERNSFEVSKSVAFSV